MKKYILILLIVFPIISFSQSGFHYVHHHMVNGTDTAELYISTLVYSLDYDSVFTLILHSNDNGESLLSKHKSFNSGYSNKPIPIFADSARGVIYRKSDINPDSLLTSFDTGMTFVNNYMHLPAAIASGCRAGELIVRTLTSTSIFRSTDFANTFDTIVIWDSDSLSELLDVGVLPGELYFEGAVPADSNAPYSFLPVAYTSDYGANVNTKLVSISPCWWSSFDLRHGTEPGEYYLMVFFGGYEDNFDIYHVTNYGNNVTYQSNQVSLGYVSFTAGRKPGTFYYCKRDYEGPFLYIYYSTDYGVTFTTYTHIMDSNYNGIPETDKDFLHVYPNPAKNLITITLPQNTFASEYVLYDFLGRPVLQKVTSSAVVTSLDISKIPNGLFFLKVTLNNGLSEVSKVLIKR